ncbi:putative peptidoglycan binding domain protein [Actinomadura rubteroloni]|uniref:Putative peptidoglycan binding domain protein n=1 Tax=Actinomadura rubteroloni TaxID=1926885 RepID=A0A2P4UKA1_9ACTN|nr:peptidoglycan-binding protein [Actinomadura rubteroloni]POM25448.1 putative peptidoglycan binding domain protein [Actinomadura rubteroloni]
MRQTKRKEVKHLDKVDAHPDAHRSTEPDERDILGARQDATHSSMLAEARKSLGLKGRPNAITRSYAARHGKEYLTASWCDMAITYWARHSGNADAVLPGGDRAYTVYHAEDFRKAGTWHAGTTDNVRDAKPGDIVFFDWGTSNSIDAVDHVGVVEKNLGGGRLQTIEANTGNAVRRRVRAAGVIAGFGRPSYDANWTESMVKKLPELAKGARGEHVETVQALLQARSHPDIKVTGRFDDATEKAVRAVQKWGKVHQDGVVGPQTWPVLLRVHT